MEPLVFQPFTHSKLFVEDLLQEQGREQCEQHRKIASAGDRQSTRQKYKVRTSLCLSTPNSHNSLYIIGAQGEQLEGLWLLSQVIPASWVWDCVALCGIFPVELPRASDLEGESPAIGGSKDTYGITEFPLWLSG